MSTQVNPMLSFARTLWGILLAVFGRQHINKQISPRAAGLASFVYVSSAIVLPATLLAWVTGKSGTIMGLLMIMILISSVLMHAQIPGTKMVEVGNRDLEQTRVFSAWSVFASQFIALSILSFMVGMIFAGYFQETYYQPNNGQVFNYQVELAFSVLPALIVISVMWFGARKVLKQ